MDITEFLNKFNDAIKYAEYNGGYEIAFPFKLYNDDHISSVFITQNETGLFTITDNGNTMKYLDNNGVDIEKYSSRIKKICDMFNLTIEGDTVKSVLGEYETNQTFTMLTNFLIGISHIVTLRCFD